MKQRGKKIGNVTIIGVWDGGKISKNIINIIIPLTQAICQLIMLGVGPINATGPNDYKIISILQRDKLIFYFITNVINIR